MANGRMERDGLFRRDRNLPACMLRATSVVVEEQESSLPVLRPQIAAAG
jgi:hypothetical protein